MHVQPNRRLKRAQAGDTIVEVLVAIAIVSSVLGLAYGTMNRGLLQTRHAQERTQALKALEGQLELIKYSTSTHINIQPVGATFCLTNTAGQPVAVPIGGGALNSSLAADDFTAYPAACTNSFYHLGIVRENASGGRLYRVYARWDKLGAAGRDEIQMVYLAEAN